MPVELNIYVKELGLLCAYDSIFNMGNVFSISIFKRENFTYQDF